MKIFRFFYEIPDGTRWYHLDTSCNFGNVDRAKHYLIDDPEKQKEVIAKSFLFAYTEFPAYRNHPAWKGNWYGAISIRYEEVIPEDMRPWDKILLGISKRR